MDLDHLDEIIKQMQRLTRESRRLIDAHNEVIREYEILKKEFDLVRAEREREREREREKNEFVNPE